MHRLCCGVNIDTEKTRRETITVRDMSSSPHSTKRFTSPPINGLFRISMHRVPSDTDQPVCESLQLEPLLGPALKAWATWNGNVRLGTYKISVSKKGPGSSYHQYLLFDPRRCADQGVATEFRFCKSRLAYMIHRLHNCLTLTGRAVAPNAASSMLWQLSTL